MRVNGSGATIESCIPGRIRARLPYDLRKEDVVSDIRLLLEDIDGVQNVRINMATGSVLVEHDPEIVETDKLIEAGQAASIINNYIGENNAVLQEQPWPDVSDTAKSILRSFRKLDRGVNQLTNGKIDAKMTAALLLVGLAAGRAVSGKAVPTPWYALFWYGYSMFMQWHNPSRSGGSME